MGDQTITFASIGDGTFSDEETGSTWLINGEDVDAELADTQLERALNFAHFWFAWRDFFQRQDPMAARWGCP